MFIRRLEQNIRGHDWYAVVVELLVIMVGLVAAFQVDRWWEARGERVDEEMYISRLISDVEDDIPSLEYAISLAEVRLGFGDFLAKVGADPSAALDKPAYFLAAISQAAYTYTPSLSSNTFEDLRSTGNLKLIRDHDVKQALQSYYKYDEGQRQFISLNLMTEFRYFELSAGIATLEQYRFVQEHWYVVNSTNLGELQDVHPEEEGVRAAAKRLRANAEFLAWLPRVRGLQIDQIQANSGRLESARSLLDTLQEYAVRIND
jgi:hypothetical protein